MLSSFTQFDSMFLTNIGRSDICISVLERKWILSMSTMVMLEEKESFECIWGPVTTCYTTIIKVCKNCPFFKGNGKSFDSTEGQGKKLLVT